MNVYIGGNSFRRYFAYPFYYWIEKKLKKLKVDADFKFYLSFFDFKNISNKSVLDVGTDPASPFYFLKNKPRKLIIARNETIPNINSKVDLEIISLDEIKNIDADILKFDYSLDTRRFFDNIDLSKYNEWVIIFDSNVDSYDYEVKTRLMRSLGGKIIGSKNGNIIVWGKINKF